VSDSRPRVTVGVPVFNGEAFLAETLDSLLKQTFTDFEIVISDNASTDRTEEICRDYAARDARVRYYRSDVNRGAAWNHNRVFELARGEYFKWNSADDLCAPEFLARCVIVLDANPNAVMAMPDAVRIGEHGEPLGRLDSYGQALSPVVPPAAAAHVRFRQNIRMEHFCLSIYGLIRTEVLRQTKLIGPYADSDRNLLAHLALLGDCVDVPEVLLFNRDHPGRFTRIYKDDYFHGWRQYMNWFDPANARRKTFPFWRKSFELWRVIRRSPLPRKERTRCYWELLRWLSQKENVFRLYDDATFYPRKWVVHRFPKAKLAWNRLWNKRPVEPARNA
jgi:glycosyltransferase involved in cell wall biosynthesis